MVYYICNECVKHKLLKRLIKEKGKEKNCSFCGKNNMSINISEDDDFKLLIKALIRYYYSESDYNPNVGGDSVEGILKKENELLNFIIPKEIDCDYDDMYRNIVPNDDDYGKGVSLYYREACGDRGWYFAPLKDEAEDIEYMMEYYNPYIISRIITSRIKKYANKLFIKTNGNRLFYRARVGVDKEMYENAEYPQLICKKILPYRAKQIGAPNPTIAMEGRLNRKGTSFLYLASDEETAISEVKPNRGHLVSIANFKVKGGLKIADFRDMDIYKFYHNDDEIEDFIFIKTLAEKMSLPNPEQRYSFTQAITDSLIAIGFDGAVFNSSLTRGYNLVIFSPENAEYVNGTAKAVSIKKTEYIYDEVDSNIIADKFYEWGNNDKNRGGALGEELIEK